MQEFKPSASLGNKVDFFFIILSSFIGVLFFFVIPTIISYYFYNDATILIWAMIFIVFYDLSFCLQTVLLDQSGIHFIRYFRKTITIPWDNLECAKEANSIKNILHENFWPPFFNKHFSFSLNYHDKIKFTYNGNRSIYFSPKNINEFLKTSNKYKKQEALTQLRIRNPYFLTTIWCDFCGKSINQLTEDHFHYESCEICEEYQKTDGEWGYCNNKKSIYCGRKIHKSDLCSTWKKVAWYNGKVKSID